jgi:hypothetical protein
MRAADPVASKIANLLRYKELAATKSGRVSAQGMGATGCYV